MCVNCRAITAIGFTLEQINKFYEDLVELDKVTGFEYDDKHSELLNNAERLRADFSALYSQILVDFEDGKGVKSDESRN